MRLDKFLTECGLGSRKEVKSLLTSGKIKVNGEIVKNPQSNIKENEDKVEYNNRVLEYSKFRYYIMNKKAGYITAVEDPREKTVMELLPDWVIKKELAPVGRLDKDTEGLLLLTNDGVLAHNLLSPKKHIDKTYFAILDGPVGTKEQELFLQGLDIGDEKLALPAKLELTENENEVFITVQEGRFHQVKRMAQAVGRNVTYLKRISMGNLVLDPNLKKGEYRSLTEKELTSLKKK